jgi:hypothetical protein
VCHFGAKLQTVRSMVLTASLRTNFGAASYDCNQISESRNSGATGDLYHAMCDDLETLMQFSAVVVPTPPARALSAPLRDFSLASPDEAICTAASMASLEGCSDDNEIYAVRDRVRKAGKQA